MTESHLPLYHGSAAPEPDFNAMNQGLWFERFFDAYESDFSAVGIDARKLWLNRFSRKPTGQGQSLQKHAQRLLQLAAAQRGQARVYHCAGNFVTGTGNAHPLENGFLWHPTLGTPYLSGSAVKGLVRAVIETAYQGEDKSALLQRWFGSAEKGDVAKHSGQFIFLDALPVQPCQLHVEVMTPHMGKWYEQGSKTPLTADAQPGDWHAPVPIGYLTARSIKLQFIILPRPGAGEADALAKELDDLWQALEHGLQYLGAGAKTAIGFGLMQRDTKAEASLQEALQAEQRAAQLQTLSPVMQDIMKLAQQWQERHQQLRGKKENLNATIHNQARELAKKAHAAADWSAEEKQAAASAIEEWLPKLVNGLDPKEVRKQFKLNTLKGQ
ncbi:type III-B CRISPR module RAMP protein Cmr6 [Vandammella animalimorsus]|uniref:Type III-B CRISPR module RAMP protein Cmr6 n=1 Tax=Vandammella animalimorsus TaxID=2029117 RepID=A0A2A2AFE8_9BURK|nr:type III-B CRISPR module RAMP protein Cmr6 [Vandammella animalimorsus]PAT36464.1 type III-B CRISPR module RAMP protein Cmr6 [Vandammella animalimorsus]